MRKKILITGSAGFIGFHLSNSLSDKYTVVGIDNYLNETKSEITKIRSKKLSKKKNFTFLKIDISKKNKLEKVFKKYKFDIVINLAAIPGVRNSFFKPDIYFKNNIEGFYNIYSLSIKCKVKLFIYGSSSSVYGNSNKEETNNPISFYAATKKCNEIIAHSFIENTKMKVVGLRFFTVYGPFGRPDMAIFKFAKLIEKNKPIHIFNYGNHTRDFSYIDDTIHSIVLIIKNQRKLKNYQLLDIGKGKNDKLFDLINIYKKKFRKKFRIKKISKQIGDVETTKANIKPLKSLINFYPKTSLDKGIGKFFEWFVEYYKK